MHNYDNKYFMTKNERGRVPRLTSDSSPRAGKDRYLCSKKFSMSLIIFSMSLNRELNDAGSMLEGEKTLSQGARSSRWWSRALCRWTGTVLLLNPRHQRAWTPRRFLGIILDIILPRKFEVNKSTFCAWMLFILPVSEWRFYVFPEVSDEIR